MRQGNVNARKFQSRLADMASASSVTDLMTDNPHPRKGARPGQYALSVGDWFLPQATILRRAE